MWLFLIANGQTSNDNRDTTSININIYNFFFLLEFYSCSLLIVFCVFQRFHIFHVLMCPTMFISFGQSRDENEKCYEKITSSYIYMECYSLHAAGKLKGKQLRNSLMIMNWLHSIWIPVKINAIDYARIECRVSVSFFSFVHMAQVAMLQISNAYNSLID